LVYQGKYQMYVFFFLSSDCHFFKAEDTATIPTDFCRVSWNHRSLLVHHSQEFKNLQMLFDENIQPLT